MEKEEYDNTVPKVVPLDESQLVGLGFRSQKDLSIVSQAAVWPLTDGFIGSDSSHCSMCIKHKAVASQHAQLTTMHTDGLTDGFFLTGKPGAMTSLLLSAERGVRTMTRIETHVPFKVGSEVQLCITRIEYRRHRKSTALKGLTTHASVSDMFGSVDETKSGGMPSFVLNGMNGVLPDSSGLDFDKDEPEEDVLPVTPSGKRRVRFDKAVTNEGESWDIGPSMTQRAEQKEKGHVGKPKKTSYVMLEEHMHVEEDHMPHIAVHIKAMGGAQAGKTFICRSAHGTVVVGSDPTCDLVVTGAEVSPLHARIMFSDGHASHGDLRTPIEDSDRGGKVPDDDDEALMAPGFIMSPSMNRVSGGSDQHSFDPFSTKLTDFCWIQDLAIGNRHGTQVAVQATPVALQRGDILVLCKDTVSTPPDGTVIATAAKNPLSPSFRSVTPKIPGTSLSGRAVGSGETPWAAGAGSNGSAFSGSNSSMLESATGVAEGDVEASRRTKPRKSSKGKKKLNGPRVELAILFHSETSSPVVSWSRLALRITRTRRSRRKSMHRTTSGRFPSKCVVIGRLGATVGRSPQCDLFIDDLTAANFHAQVVYVHDGYVLQTIADPDYFGTFILLGRKSAPRDRYRHESKGLYQLETNDIFRCGTTEFFVEEIKTEDYQAHQRRLTSLRTRVKFLRRSPLFSLLPELDLNRIANAARDVLAMEGQDFITQGDMVDKDACFFFIEKGEVGVMIRRRNSSGYDIINTLARGQCFGEMALLAEDRPRAATVRAMSEVLAWVLDQQSFRELLGPVMNAAIKLIARKRETSIRMELFARLFPRLARLLHPRQMRELAQESVPVSFKEDEVVVRQGAACHSIFFVVGGRAERTWGDSMTGKAVEVEMASLSPMVKPGNCVGDASLLFGEPHTATVTATQPMACLALDVAKMGSYSKVLNEWFLKKWGHHQHVKDMVASAPRSPSSAASGSVNALASAASEFVATNSPHGSTVDFSGGSEASSVLDLAAAQHAKAKTDRWRKSSLIKTSGNSLVASDRGDELLGQVTTASIDGDSERGNDDDDDDEEDGEVLSTNGSSRSARKSDAGGSVVARTSSQRRRSLVDEESKGDGSGGGAAIVKVGQNRRGSVQSLPPDDSYKDFKKNDKRSRRFSSIMTDFEEEIMKELGEGSGRERSASDSSPSLSADFAASMADAGKPIYTAKEHIPISSTNPTVEEVKMLSRVPRFLILRALTGPARGTYFYLTSDVTTIGGPGGNATVKLPDKSLSPDHAVIEYQDGAFWLRDQKSSTGTFLKLAGGKDYTMEMGDVFSIGHVEMMVLGQPGALPTPVVPQQKACCSIS